MWRRISGRDDAVLASVSFLSRAPIFSVECPEMLQTMRMSTKYLIHMPQPPMIRRDRRRGGPFAEEAKSWQ